MDGNRVLHSRQVVYATTCTASTSFAATWYTLHTACFDTLNGRSWMSVWLYPGILPGNSKAWCSTYENRNRTTNLSRWVGECMLRLPLVLVGSDHSSSNFSSNSSDAWSPTQWKNKNIQAHQLSLTGVRSVHLMLISLVTSSSRNNGAGVNGSHQLSEDCHV